MRINIAINKATFELKKNNINTALLDSEILMSKVLNKSRKFLILNQDQELDNNNYKYYRELINERCQGKPIAYLTGTKSFWKYEFDINDKILIPRPDTELIVEQVLKIYKNKSVINVLEIGVGSGCILLSILKEKIFF